MMLSILIPSIPKRKIISRKLLNEVYIQRQRSPEELGEVEILVDDSPAFLDGGLSIGKKRQALLDRASGKYLCYLDDDENISPDYLDTLLRLCAQDKDVCTFRSLFKCDTYWSVIDMSLYFPENEEATPERIVKRKAWHICPVKSEHAKLFQFEDINNAEDWRWFVQVYQRLVSEAKTDRIIHQYNHHSKKSEADKIEFHV